MLICRISARRSVSKVALPVGAISNANSDESQPTMLFLNLLDTVYRGCLAFIKRLGNILASQLDHFRHQVVAQGSEVCGGSGRNTACDPTAIDNNNFLALRY